MQKDADNRYKLNGEKEIDSQLHRSAEQPEILIVSIRKILKTQISVEPFISKA